MTTLHPDSIETVEFVEVPTSYQFKTAFLEHEGDRL